MTPNRLAPQIDGVRTTGGPQRLFGVHTSVAGGLWRAFDQAKTLRCTCMQVFVKNQRQWSAKPLSADDIQLFRERAQATSIAPVLAHASYLINIASPSALVVKRSAAALIDEIERCAALGVPFLVLHPGAHMGAGVSAGLKRAVKSLARVLRSTANFPTQILLETTAGQGSSLGASFDELGRMLAALAQPERVAVCVDTCHVFAAGYDLRTSEGLDALIADAERHVGLSAIRCIHLNDSVAPHASRVDRHAHLGRGQIGAKGLARFVTDPRLAHIPLILETPKGSTNGRDWDVMNLNRLRRMLAGAQPAAVRPAARRTSR